MTADLIGKIDAYLRKAIRWGYNGNLKMSELLHGAYMKLFRQICFADRTTTHNSSIDTSLIRDIYCGPEVLFETSVAMKFVDDDNDDDDVHKIKKI